MSIIIRKTTEWIGNFIQSYLTPLMLPIIESNLIPDFILRFAIRRILYISLSDLYTQSFELLMKSKMVFIRELQLMPIAVEQVLHTTYYTVLYVLILNAFRLKLMISIMSYLMSSSKSFW